MKNNWTKRLLAAALVLALSASLAVTAAAAGPWAADQSYTEDRTQEKVFAVRVESDEEENEALRDRLLDAGFDAYLYEDQWRVYVLSGKFRDSADARAYKTELEGVLTGVKLYINRAWLPEEAVAAFETASNGDVLVYSVAVATSGDLRQAEALCKKVQDKGFDAFLHEENGIYQVMCGKFYDLPSALTYRDCIWGNTDRKDPYVSQIVVPVAEVNAFLYDLTGRGLPGPVLDELEKPTGPYCRARDGSVEAYTVQISAGTSFSGAERTRDAMIDAGYSAFVYEYCRIYEIMCGGFNDKAAAEALCEDIHANTGYTGAYVTGAWLPASMVK